MSELVEFKAGTVTTLVYMPRSGLCCVYLPTLQDYQNKVLYLPISNFHLNYFRLYEGAST